MSDDDGTASPGFSSEVGIQVTEHDDDGDGSAVVEAVLDAGPRHLNRHGTVHGGALATLVDSAMGAAVADAGSEAPVTIEMKVTYLEPAQPGRVTARATVRKRGRRVTIVEAEVEQDDELVAHAIATFAS
jgi:uncharacterized protein (TIGR00369 family)